MPSGPPNSRLANLGTEGAEPPTTSNPAVFQAYVELSLAADGQQRVETLERLYARGWQDGVRVRGDGKPEASDAGGSR